MKPGAGYWREAGMAVLIGAVLLAAQLKILTYVTGEDPYTYTRLAIELIDQRFSPEAWRSVAGFIAPGYPALLAGAMMAFGPYAVAWVNMALLLVAFVLLYAVCRRWGFSPADAGIVVLAALAFTLRGGPLNAHFLLYAFRGAPQFLFMVWALYLVVTASPPSRWAGVRLGLATLVVLAGCTLRETTALVWPGLMAYVWYHPDWRSQRRLATFGLAVPLLAAVAAGLILLAWGPLDGNVQARAWLRRLSRDGVVLYLKRLAAYGQNLVRAGGWPAAALFIWGTWRSRRRPERLAVLLLPPALLAAFYAGFLVHPRYLLDSCLWVWAVAGMGAAFLAADVARIWSRAGRGVPAAVIGLLLAANALAISALPMWGPRVRRAQLRHFVAAIEELLGERREVLVPIQDRYLADALTVFARRQPRGFVSAADDILRTPPLLYLHPESRGHWKQPGGMGLAEAIERYADMTPIPAAAEPAHPVRLGPLRYTLFRVTPWTNAVVAEALSPKHAAGRLLWLDFRQSDPHAVREIRRLDRHGNVRQSWTLPPGNGLVPLSLANDVAWRAHARLVATSSSPMPRHLLARPLQRAGSGLFTLSTGRRDSAMDWVDAPARKAMAQDKWGATFTDEATFRIPRPVGGDSGSYLAHLVYQPRYTNFQPAVFRYREGERMLATFTNALDGREIVHAVPLGTAGGDAGPAIIRLQVEDAALATNHFRIVAIGAGMAAPDR